MTEQVVKCSESDSKIEGGVGNLFDLQNSVDNLFALQNKVIETCKNENLEAINENRYVPMEHIAANFGKNTFEKEILAEYGKELNYLFKKLNPQLKKIRKPIDEFYFENYSIDSESVQMTVKGLFYCLFSMGLSFVVALLYFILVLEVIGPELILALIGIPIGLIGAAGMGVFVFHCMILGNDYTIKLTVWDETVFHEMKVLYSLVIWREVNKIQLIKSKI